MKNKILITLAVVALFAFAVPALADTCNDNPGGCGNGSPELVTNAWGTSNSQIPHILQGQSVVMSNGMTTMCPIWFPMYCVDISHTQYFLSHWGK